MIQGKQRHTAGRRRRGFTLIEIMAVVLIMGLLAALVGTQVAGQIGKARAQTAKAQIKKIESAVEFFQMDNGFFPSSEQGLSSLVEKPTIGKEPRSYPAGGYLTGGAVPNDPWDNPYQYEYPGSMNAGSYDIWSLGADGEPGGDGTDADIGNWAAAREAG